MYFIDVKNSNNQAERVFIDNDIYLSVFEPTVKEKNNILNDIIKEVQRRNKQRGINTQNKKRKGNTQIVRTASASTFKNGIKVPIFNQCNAADYTLYNDGTYDYNEVRSQNYNDDYFNFNELKKLL